ncbi:MAG: hypothetical protein BIFFINMI_02899 [Phycisphaerae bacterium]|nr:hypothetical protein [Phycisphaerae bacterium]
MIVGAAIPLDRAGTPNPLFLQVLRGVGGTAAELQGGGYLIEFADRLRAGDGSFLAPLAERFAMPIQSFHAPFGPKCDLSSPSASVRRDAIESAGLISGVVTRAVGGRYVVIHPSHLMGLADERAERRRHCVASLRKVADLLADRGLCAAVENMVPSCLASDVRELIEIVDEVDRPNVGVCLDCGHAHFNHHIARCEVRCPRIRGPFDGPLPTAPDAVRLIGRRLMTLHVHDNAGDRDNHFFPRLGTIDWPAFFAALGEIGYRGVFMHEVAVGEADFLADPAAREAFIADYREFLAPVAAM